MYLVCRLLLECYYRPLLSLSFPTRRSSDLDRSRLDRLRDYDCSWGTPGVGRFRVNILRQRSSFMIVMRVIPFDVPTFETLGLPAILSSGIKIGRAHV